MSLIYINENGEVLDLTDTVNVAPQPQNTSQLEGIALVATLNAVLGIWSLPDAANIAGLTEEDLINEALAWGVAANMGNYE